MQNLILQQGVCCNYSLLQSTTAWHHENTVKMLLETVGDAASAAPPPAPAASSSCNATLPSHGSSAAKIQHLRGLTGNSGLKSWGYTLCSSSIAGGVHPILYGSRVLQGSSHPHPSSSPQAEGGMGGFDSHSTAAHHQYGGDEIEGRGEPPTPGMLQHPASMLNWVMAPSPQVHTHAKNKYRRAHHCIDCCWHTSLLWPRHANWRETVFPLNMEKLPLVTSSQH